MYVCQSVGQDENPFEVNRLIGATTVIKTLRRYPKMIEM